MDRLAQNQEFFRVANERLEERVEQLGAKDTVPFLCECADVDCMGRVNLTLDEYGRIRARENRFVIEVGHAMVEGEHVVEDGPQFQIVEKEA
jgi:hypothetical protein